MIWERRGDNYLGRDGDYQYRLVPNSSGGWAVSVRIFGDWSWSLISYYPDAKAAQRAAEQDAKTRK